MCFKDHFSGHADVYQRYRPTYPAALFEFLASLTATHDLALDCATGNGQAAVALAHHYARVVASDGSRAQLARAARHPRIFYIANLAEAPALRSGSVDLVTAAQAAHWFDFDRFYPQVRRVLRAGGALALWSYETFSIEPAVDAIVDHFYREVLRGFWPAERRYVEEGYRSLPFRFLELPAPTLRMEAEWNLDTVIGYIGTWSAVQRYRKAHGLDPLATVRPLLEAAWGPGATVRSVHWPLHLRVGRAT